MPGTFKMLLVNIFSFKNSHAGMVFPSLYLISSDRILRNFLTIPFHFLPHVKLPGNVEGIFTEDTKLEKRRKR